MRTAGRKYPGWYPKCDTCNCEPGHKCWDMRSLNAGNHEVRDFPHPGRKQATTRQLQKRGLRDRT